MITIGEEREHFGYDVIRGKPVEEISQMPYTVIAIVLVFILLITTVL